MATVMNEDQIQILAEALGKALEIINQNQMRLIDERFDAIMDGKDEAESAELITEDRVREIAEDEARDLINGASISA